mgnify:CR=1 FL=1
MASDKAAKGGHPSGSKQLPKFVAKNWSAQRPRESEKDDLTPGPPIFVKCVESSNRMVNKERSLSVVSEVE